MKTKKKSLGQVAYEACFSESRHNIGILSWIELGDKMRWRRVARAVLAAHKGRK